MKKVLGIVLLVLIFAGCSTPHRYTQDSVGTMESLYRAEIVNVRMVEIQDDGEGVIWGGIGGGFLGSLFGGTTRDQQWATAVGALVGAMAGSQVNKDSGQELTLRFEDGREVVTVQRIDKNTPISFRTGDRVKVYMSGGKISRIYLEK